MQCSCLTASRNCNHLFLGSCTGSRVSLNLFFNPPSHPKNLAFQVAKIYVSLLQIGCRELTIHGQPLASLSRLSVKCHRLGSRSRLARTGSGSPDQTLRAVLMPELRLSTPQTLSLLVLMQEPRLFCYRLLIVRS